MSDLEIIRFLAEKVMGGEVVWYGELSHFRQTPQSHWRAWNPLTSIEDAFEVQAAIPEGKQESFSLYLDALLYDESEAYQKHQWKVANATPRERSIAAVKALGGEA